MPYKDPVKQKESQAEWNRRVYRDFFIFTNSLRRMGCMDCGNDDPRVLQFHHRPGETKTKNIGGMHRRTIEQIMEECLKCDILCANCHAIRHAEERLPT